jgi:hypothetical protein
VTPVGQGVGQHADDLVHFAVDPNLAPDDVGIAGEAPLPEPVADQEDAVVAEDRLVVAESAAEPWLDPQDGKEIVGDAEAAGHLRGLSGFGQVHVREGVAGDLAVAGHLRLQIEVVGRRDPTA